MRQLLGLLLLTGLTACNTDTFVSATSPVEPTSLSSQTPMPMISPLPSITPSPDSAVTPDVPTPTNNSQEPPRIRILTNIASEDIQAVWWSQDSSTLFYGVPYQNLAYDIERETAQELPLEELYEQTAEPQILSHLPPEAIRIYVSPSGNSALYFKIIRLSRTPTPSETAEMGEYTTRGTIAELWFQEEGGYRSKIGELEFCGFDDAFWTNDELKVVIPRGPSISLCGETYAWLVDIPRKTLHPLFPVEDYPVAVRTYDMSPDGKSLLFGFGIHEGDQRTNPLYLLDLDSLTTERLDTPQLAHGEQWLTNNKLLISYKKRSQVDLTLGLFDLETSEVVELTPMFHGLCIRFASVSPDRKWLTFATGERCDILNDLWLMPLELGE